MTLREDRSKTKRRQSSAIVPVQITEAFADFYRMSSDEHSDQKVVNVENGEVEEPKNEPEEVKTEDAAVQTERRLTITLSFPQMVGVYLVRICTVF